MTFGRNIQNTLE